MYLDILKQVRYSAAKKILFLSHAIDQMNRGERMISPAEVRSIIENGEIIEDYPEDHRGHSCLIFGYSSQARPIHIVCAPKVDYLAIITAYIPDKNKWSDNYKQRKEP